MEQVEVELNQPEQKFTAEEEFPLFSEAELAPGGISVVLAETEASPLLAAAEPEPVSESERLLDSERMVEPDLEADPEDFVAAAAEISETAPLDAPAQESAEAPRAISSEITVIPDRVYFRIGDVAEITGIKPYVLRFWEKEFEIISPVKNSSGQRVYRRSDVEAVLLIKRLLYSERFSIEGAKRRIRELRKHKELASAKRKRGELDDAKLAALLRVRLGLTELAALANARANSHN